MKTCENCETEHEGTYGSGRFCSSKCARGFSTKAKRKEINERVSNTLTGSGHGNVKLTCKNCEVEFEVGWNRRHQEFCNISCSTHWKNKTLDMARLGGLASSSKSIKRSKNEIMFADLCNAHFKNVKTNEPIFNGWDADVILVNEKIAILWNGKWHYEKITKSHSIEQVQCRDKIKIQEIKNTGYLHYTIKDMGKYNPDFVKEEFNKFLNSGELSSSRVS